MTIRLLTFDLDNTLWDADPVIARAEKLTHDWVCEHVPQAASLYSLDALLQYRNQIEASYPDLRFRVSKLREEVMLRVFLQAGIEREQAAQLAKESFDVFYRARSEITLFDGAEQILEDLKKDYTLMALTNGNSDLKLVGIDHLFAEHFNAEDVGAPKPQPAMFEAAFAASGVPAHEGIHIGDHQEQDVVAAARLGMKTIWVNLTDAAWAEAEAQPDQEITHLSQLPAAVRAIVQAG